MNWEGRVAVITGGASGIGEATAREFAVEGVSVAILDINAEAGERVASQFQAEGYRAAFYHLDVADRDACGRVVDSIAAEWGRVDFLVNSAASFIGKGLDVTTADWERSLGVNVR